MVKKDRQQNYYTIAYSQKYVTNILPDSLTKTTDANPVYFTHNLFEPDTIRETSNDRTNRVPINHLLLNKLLPDRTFLSNSIALKPTENLSAL
ncbi:hypothetical protein QUB37_22740 [Microcoleus sp. AT3-A2]|uniref:hypothetical protein n=1 Tax=Microcoleus sp. AT3-A2 TaxID=2818610 RepID=UPI002FD13D32